MTLSNENQWSVQKDALSYSCLCIHRKKHIPCVHSHQRVEHHLKKWSVLKAGELGKRQAGPVSKTSDEKGSQSSKRHVHNVIPE